MSGSDVKKDIINTIQKTSGEYTEFTVFTDFIQMSAIAISNTLSLFHDKIWEDRENAYLRLMNKYSAEKRELFPRLFSMLSEAYEDEISDVLGEIFMSKEFGSSTNGQFFTPFHVSLVTAELTVRSYTETDKVVLNEPSCGSGGMIIAIARVLHERGLPYQRMMRVVAQDLDWNAVYMCYVQCSLLGIDAICVQGDTLSESYNQMKTERRRMLRTPRNVGAII